jgi:cell division protein FtsN
MRSRIRHSSRFGEVVTFWAIIVACSLLLSALSFVAAKYWVGGLMARSKTAQSGPQLVLKTPDDAPDDEVTDGEGERVDPPSQAVVKMQQRAPTDGEKSEVEQQFPQDAADLHKAGDQDATDDSTGGDDKPLDDTAASGSAGQQYSVVASSFRDEANARRAASELEGRGYSPRLVEVVRDGQTFHRVVVASFADRAEAEKMRDRLKSEGTAATVMTR